VDDVLLDQKQGSASRARSWIVGRARDARLSDDEVDVVELLAAELIANAMKHGPAGGEVQVETRNDPDRFGVFVFDDTALIPVLQDPAPDALGGRGILLVDALATDWGYSRMGPSSKAVWFFLAVRRLAAA
jgi:anti-sigma regulatory factor (Ser/Thr protein kinase)